MMLKQKIVITLGVMFLTTVSFAQKDPVFTAAMKKAMCEKVKQAAQHAWQGYKQFAWGADDLKPLARL